MNTTSQETNSKPDHPADPVLLNQPGQLVAYLHKTGRIAADETPTVEILSGGVSCLTMWVRRGSAGGGDWVVKQALAKLKVKVDWFSDPKRVVYEALALQWLTKLAPPGTITPLIFLDEDYFLLAMEAVPQPHDNWKTLLLDGKLEMDHVTQCAVLLGQIHKHSSEQSETVAPLFDDRSFYESLRLEAYYAYAGQQVPKASEFIIKLIADTRSRRFTLVHGDYSPKNMLIHQGKLILLDHEVIHFGDPAFDLGFLMTHLLSKAHFLPARRQDFIQAAVHFWQQYTQTLGSVPWGDDLEAYAVNHTLGCLLARVAGRSPLEYLTGAHRQHQQEIVAQAIALRMAKKLETFEQLFDLWQARL